MVYRLTVALALLVAGAAQAQETVEGPATVEDAATIAVEGRTLRLYGIAAPRPGERCTMRGVEIDCGHIAATALMDLTVAAEVTCRILDAGAEPPVALCTAGGYDLSEGMVHTGWARPLPGAAEKLFRSQELARSRDQGLWSGTFPDSVEAAAGPPPGG